MATIIVTCLTPLSFLHNCYHVPLHTKTLNKTTLRSFCSCSGEYYLNQSRDGLPRFFSHILPSQKLKVEITNAKSPQNTMKLKTEKRQYWLLKTETSEWSWEDQEANNGVSKWDGVKNKQAINNLLSMRLGDLCFFYHSGIKARCVVGVVQVVRTWYTEGESGDGAVDVKAVGEMRQPVDLKEMKKDEDLKGFQLFRQPRLSVVPVEKKVWNRICELGGGFEEDCDWR